MISLSQIPDLIKAMNLPKEYKVLLLADFREKIIKDMWWRPKKWKEEQFKIHQKALKLIKHK